MFTLPVVAFVVAEAVGIARSQPSNKPAKSSVTRAPRHLGLPSSGVDYYAPNTSRAGCGDWTWLYDRCFDAVGGGPVGAKRVLKWDLQFAHQEHLGRFYRLWVSLDQLINWNRNGGFGRLIPSRLANLDSALQTFRTENFKVDVVLFAYEKHQGWRNEFRPQALDGDHGGMRMGYLNALRSLIAHLAASRAEAGTVKVIDLFNEPYFQLERYFDTPSALGKFGACRTPSGAVSSSCVDEKIIHRWLDDLYRTARAASHAFLYTASDSGRLLNTNGSMQAHWVSMYPVDVYDIHLYDSTPWKQKAVLKTALNLKKPWFSGEVGCGSGQVSCTYNGTRSAVVDKWWLGNLVRYRAQSALVEDRGTVWDYPFGTAALTATGQVLQCHADSAPPACDSRDHN